MTELTRLGKFAAKRAGAKAVKRAEKISESFTLSPVDATTYRALSARANFLAQDRADIGFATKELCKEFSVPRRLSQQRLKRLGRYLMERTRCVTSYNYQEKDRVITTWVDSDYARCKKTRKSTSGGITMFGTHPIKSWATTQGVIALSSGEAEYYSRKDARMQ